MNDKEQFEAWMKERFPDSDTTGFAPVMFVAWQASRRAALEESAVSFDKFFSRSDMLDVGYVIDSIRALAGTET